MPVLPRVVENEVDVIEGEIRSLVAISSSYYLVAGARAKNAALLHNGYDKAFAVLDDGPSVTVTNVERAKAAGIRDKYLVTVRIELDDSFEPIGLE